MGAIYEKNKRPKISCYCPFKVLYLKNFGRSPDYSLLTPFLANFGLVRQSLKAENPGDRLLPPPPF
jgi:hypothetical protein